MTDAIPILTADIPLSRLQRLEERIGQVNGRARRMGVAPLVMSKGAEHPVKVTVQRQVYETGKGWITHLEDRSVPGISVSIEGDVPRIEGWRPVGYVNIKSAFIDAETGEAKAMPATAFLGFKAEDVRETLVARLDATGRIPCDHCKTVRNRKEAFIVESTKKPGERIVVGSECFKDFSGHDPAMILRGYMGLARAQEVMLPELRQYRVELQYDWASFERAEKASRIGLDRFLAAVFDCARETGFRSEDSEHPTAKAAVAMLRAGRDPSHEAFASADAVRRWLPQMGYRLDDLWRAKNFGEEIALSQTDLAARCVLAWCQATGTALQGSHFGGAGERIEARFVVAGRKRYQDHFTNRDGRTHQRIVTTFRFVGPDGSVAYWSTSSTPDLENGDRIICKATVKATSVSPSGRAVTEFSRISGIKPAQEQDFDVLPERDDAEHSAPRP